MTLGRQLAVLFQQAHENSIGVREVGELTLELIRPFPAVEEVVAKPPDDHQHRQ
jgi:hypothetical protein